MIDRIDRVALPIVGGAILALGIAVGMEPEVISGTPHPVAGSYFDAGEESAQGKWVPPLSLPEWAEPYSVNGASPIYIISDEVYYSDGDVLWLDSEGIAWWDFHNEQNV